VQAGQFWLSLLFLSSCLSTAVIAGVSSFQFAGVTVYPWEWIWVVGEDACVTAVLAILVVAFCGTKLTRVYPGGKAVIKRLLSVA
jgi:hypothetical protein